MHSGLTAGSMLERLTLQNYRRFAHHDVPFRARSVLVGKNNAGKSTLIEAIRLTSLAANRADKLRYEPPPGWLEDTPAGTWGVKPALRDLNTRLDTVFHAYNDPPAHVRAKFTNGCWLDTYVGPGDTVYSVVHDARRKVVTSKDSARRAGLPRIAVLPQLGPVQVDERLLDSRTVVRGMDSPLASLHFRNQILHLKETYWEPFRELVEQTWPSVQLQEIVPPRTDSPIRLIVRDGAHVGEVAAMGHGLQMWLQVMWFVVRNQSSPTIVLDEPDVYLHADLQSRLIRLLRQSDQQVIVATHSIPIMAELAPDELLVVASDNRRSRFAKSTDEVQRAIDDVGGMHNLDLARLHYEKRCLVFEGDDDFRILACFYNLLWPGGDGLGSIPRLLSGGFSGWQKVIGAADALGTTSGHAVTTYSIFDSDHVTPEAILDRYADAKKHGVRLHIWTRKEIENYLLNPAAIARFIKDRVDSIDVSDVERLTTAWLKETCESRIQDATDEYSSSHRSLHRSLDVKTSNKWSRSFTKKRIEADGDCLGIAGGKAVFGALSDWCNDQFGVGLNKFGVANSFLPNEIDAEIRNVLGSVRARTDFPEARVWMERAKFALA